MIELASLTGLFACAAVAEIVGCYLPCDALGATVAFGWHGDHRGAAAGGCVGVLDEQVSRRPGFELVET